MLQALVSVRNVDEALQAAAAGVQLIDLKEPRSGALGALPDATLCAVVRTLADAGHGGEVSATTGDHPPTALATLLREVHRVAASGVEVVKVGVLPGPGGLELLDALSRLAVPLVPVLMVDQGLDMALVQAACERPFHAVMIDTVGKRGGSVLERLDAVPLQRFVDLARAAGRRVGVAGALRCDDLPALHTLGPDFAGFRSAVCEGDRDGALSSARLLGLMQRIGSGQDCQVD
jgi:uncharacterized protein (UPF0264 family)